MRRKMQKLFFLMEYNGRNTRFYKTGDLCYYDTEGEIMYSGRIDFQVKIQGYRIELGEIEHHARAFQQGNNAVAIPFQNASGNTEIALFLEGEEQSPAAVIQFLKTKLPAYMVPTKFVFKTVLPLNTNGKIDRKALKAFLD
jgi:acyl-coenzyme A synthetase/AMP-(fatty) acid ligase